MFSEILLCLLSLHSLLNGKIARTPLLPASPAAWLHTQRSAAAAGKSLPGRPRVGFGPLFGVEALQGVGRGVLHPRWEAGLWG